MTINLAGFLEHKQYISGNLQQEQAIHTTYPT